MLESTMMIAIKKTIPIKKASRQKNVQLKSLSD